MLEQERLQSSNLVTPHSSVIDAPTTQRSGIHVVNSLHDRNMS